MTEKKINIAIFDPIGGHTGGFARYTLGYCEEFAKQGAKVTLFTCDETHNPHPELFTVRTTLRKIYGDSPKLFRGMRYVWGWIKTIVLVKKSRTTVFNFHLFNISPIESICLSILKLLGVRIVTTCHDIVPFTSGKRTPALMKKILNLSHGIIVHSEKDRKDVLENYTTSQDKVHVIPLPAWPEFSESAPSREEAREKIGGERFKRVVLFFGNIRREKGLDVLIRAMREVVDRFPDTCLVIAGRMFKHSFDIYQEIIDELHLSGNVIKRIEYIPDEEEKNYYSASDVVVMPYLHISQSAVLLAAYSYARPVVATRVGGMPEAVVDGETGYLVDPEDPDDLAEKLILILSDPDRAYQMGQKANKYAEENFSIQSISRKIFVICLGDAQTNSNENTKDR